MDSLQVLLLLGALQGLFLAFVLVKKKNQLAHRFLALLLALMSIQVYMFSIDALYAWLGCGLTNMFSRLVFFLYGPIIYFYVRSTIDQSFKWQPANWLHALPFIVFSILSFISYGTYGKEYGLDWIHIIANTHFIFPTIHELLRLLYLLIYIGISIKWLQLYKQQGWAQFSNLEQFKVNWLYQFLAFSFIIWFVVALGLRVNYYNGNPHANAYQFIFLILPLFIYWICYQALNQPAIFSQLDLKAVKNLVRTNAKIEKKQIAKYQRSGLSQQAISTLENKLTTLMSVQEPFLNPQLKLNDLAQLLEVSSHHLSQILNDSLKQNFYEFINAYRVEKAKKNLLAPSKQHYTIEAIAFESGFQSKSTFNTVFKKKMGYTPSRWRKMMLSSGKLSLE